MKNFWFRTQRRFANIFLPGSASDKRYMFNAGREMAIRLFAENLVDFSKDTALHLLEDAHNHVRIGDDYDAGFDHAISQLRSGSSGL